MNQQQLQAIKERVDNVTENSKQWAVSTGILVVEKGGIFNGALVAHAATRFEAEFIAHSLTDVQALIAEVERLRKSLEEIAYTPRFASLPNVEAFANHVLEVHATDNSSKNLVARHDNYEEALFALLNIVANQNQDALIDLIVDVLNGHKLCVSLEGDVQEGINFFGQLVGNDESEDQS